MLLLFIIILSFLVLYEHLKTCPLKIKSFCMHINNYLPLLVIAKGYI